MLSLEGGRVLLPDGDIVVAELAIEDGVIAAIGAAAGPRATSRRIGGLLVLPGIVDLHGDGFERQIMPRPGVHFPMDMALHDTDRQLVANGITTAYHGLTWSWEPGLRGAEAARAFATALEAEQPHLAADTRLHLRFETYTLEAVAEIEGWLQQGRVDLLAFNDHTGHIAQVLGRAEGVALLAGRSGLSGAAFAALFGQVRGRAAEVPAAVARLAAAARAAGVPMASHDDETPAMRQGYHALGCTLCEFPCDAETARAARALGDPVILGAPNVIRGGSHCARLDASQGAAEGLCSVLTSDYYYPALFHAPFRVAERTGLSFAAAWALVSSAPAAAAGLTDRGAIAPGRRADLVVVDDSVPHRPRVVSTLVWGQPAFSSLHA